MSTVAKSIETTLRLTNPGDQAVAFCLEPWAREYLLEPHTSVDVVFEAESPGTPEVFHEPDRIVVYAWPTATMKVFLGEELIADFSAPCAELPEGMTLRSFFDECGYPQAAGGEEPVAGR